MKEWQKNLLATAIVMGVAAGMLGFALRPGAILGFNGGSLQRSLQSEVPSMEQTPSQCAPAPGDTWLCSVSFEPDYGSGGAKEIDYVIHEDAFGCWHATRNPSIRSSAPRRTSGCISLFDL